MSPQSETPPGSAPAMQETYEEWAQFRHELKRKRRRFSRRKVNKVVRIILFAALHVIAIALLIYIWIKFANFRGFTW
jgi:hypothetical protein